MLTLYVDTSRWRAHLRSVADATPGLVPVLKGNGYGLGNARLAAEAAGLGTASVAVGTAGEAAVAEAAGYPTVLVLTPYRPASGLDLSSPARVWTVSRVEDLPALAAEARAGGGPTPRVVLEGLTSMRRHGVPPARAGELAAAAQAAGDGVRLEGLALHLPIDRPAGVDPAAESASWLERLRGQGVAISTVYASHLTPADLGRLRGAYPHVSWRPRVGTALWLGDRTALRGRGRVLDVVPLARGERFGYRQRRAPGAGSLVVVGGGTAHGIGLVAPRAASGILARGRLLAAAGLEARGRLRSPFRWSGRRLDFAEPPHMQVSLLWLPDGQAPPTVGDELPVEVRMTTTTFDAVVDS